MKLAARARDLPALARALAARSGAIANGAPVKLVTTYFDTPDRALARTGQVLRVRDCGGGRFVQTVKSDHDTGGSPLARGEWEDEIASPAPDPQAPQTGRFLAPEFVEQLVPLFRTEITRRTITLHEDEDTRIEAAVDRGRISAASAGVAASAEASEPVSEIELELKSGDPGTLYDVALALLDVAPVRIERRSKAERGYRLAEAAPSVPVAPAHSAPIALDPAMRCGDALRRIGLACLDQVMRNEAPSLAGLPEGIHQMRVGIRRLRAALSAFRSVLPDEQRRWAADQMRWLGETLGSARNLDVFEHSLLDPAQRALHQPGGVTALAHAAEERRKAAYGRAIRAVRSRRYTASLLGLLRWFDTEGWRGGDAAAADTGNLDAPIGVVAAHILDRCRRAAKSRSKGFAAQSASERHELRIALKKLRYTAEMLSGLFEPEAVEQFIKPLKRLQDELGDANDVHVGRHIVAALTKGRGGQTSIPVAGKSVLDWHEDRLAKREPSVRKRLDTLLVTEAFWAG